MQGLFEKAKFKGAIPRDYLFEFGPHYAACKNYRFHNLNLYSSRPALNAWMYSMQKIPSFPATATAARSGGGVGRVAPSPPEVKSTGLITFVHRGNQRLEVLASGWPAEWRIQEQ